MEKKKLEQQIKKMAKAKCSYPDCKNKQFMSVSLPVGRLTEKGGVFYPDETKEQSIQVGVPLCDYHFIFAEQGIVRIIEQDGKMRLIAPLDMVNVIEGVLRAKEFMKEMKKGVKKAKQKLAEKQENNDGKK